MIPAIVNEATYFANGTSRHQLDKFFRDFSEICLAYLVK